MTCCSGSSVSSAAETMKEASFSSALIVGSFLTSTSNCSSGTSASTFLPSGPTAAASAWICSAVLAAPLAEAFFAAAFLAGSGGAADFLAAAFLAGAFLTVEDTNYLSIEVQGTFRKLRGRDKTRTCQPPRLGHCVMPTKALRTHTVRISAAVGVALAALGRLSRLRRLPVGGGRDPGLLTPLGVTALGRGPLRVPLLRGRVDLGAEVARDVLQDAARAGEEDVALAHARADHRCPEVDVETGVVGDHPQRVR